MEPSDGCPLYGGHSLHGHHPPLPSLTSLSGCWVCHRGWKWLKTYLPTPNPNTLSTTHGFHLIFHFSSSSHFLFTPQTSLNSPPFSSFQLQFHFAKHIFFSQPTNIPGSLQAWAVGVTEERTSQCKMVESFPPQKISLALAKQLCFGRAFLWEYLYTRISSTKNTPKCVYFRWIWWPY
jgi:hypothetical protein